MEPVSHNVPSSNTQIYILSLYSGTVVEHLSLQHQAGLKSGEGLGWGFSDTEIETEGLQIQKGCKTLNRNRNGRVEETEGL